MADDEQAREGISPHPAAEGIALGAGGTLDPRAAAYLEEQTRFARLQIDNLVEQNAFEVSHLRWRRFNDQMKGALQIMLVLVGALIVVGIGTAVWNASQAGGLVVDAFSVPPSFAARGIGGDVVAQDFTNKLAAIHNTTNGYSASSDVSRDHANDLSVDIPDTGVSVATVWRLLRAWLGHEQHLSGSLRDVGGGKLVLATTLNNGTAISVSGTDLNTLEQQEAEKVYCAADPKGCLNYLLGRGRWTEVYAQAQSQLASAKTPDDFALGYSMAGTLRAVLRGDRDGSLAMARIGASYAPQLANVQIQLLMIDEFLGHAENALADARHIMAEKEADQTKRMQGSGFAAARAVAAFEAAFWMGDFNTRKENACFGECASADDFAVLAASAAHLHDGAEQRALLVRASLLGPINPVNLADSETVEAAQMGDWTRVAAAARRGIAANGSDPDLWQRFLARKDQDMFTSDLAEAQAHLGDIAGARATLATTRLDCYICVVGRANVETIAGNWTAANNWFKRATVQAPSLPFADTDWGAMLLAKGDLDAAIAKFASANQKGPHFADPLEMWGEALIRENRSDLALAKFEEADKYAPNWGRLHLKWGEALWWSGDKDGARKQFDMARALDLTPAEKSELARVSVHG
jgi:tetratricopeptide (TPR) repeat protein